MFYLEKNNLTKNICSCWIFSYFTCTFFRSELREEEEGNDDNVDASHTGQIPSPFSSESNPDPAFLYPDMLELTSKHDNSSNLVDMPSKLFTNTTTPLTTTTTTTFPVEFTSVNMSNETTTTIPPPPRPVKGAQEEIKQEIQPETRQGPEPSAAEMGFQKDLWLRIKR